MTLSAFVSRVITVMIWLVCVVYTTANRNQEHEYTDVDQTMSMTPVYTEITPQQSPSTDYEQLQQASNDDQRNYARLQTAAAPRDRSQESNTNDYLDLF